jgi:MFS family permease
MYRRPLYFPLTQYDLFVINLVLRLLRDEYPEYTTSGQIQTLQGTVASAALFGAIFGQLTAGALADIIGRKGTVPIGCW